MRFALALCLIAAPLSAQAQGEWTATHDSIVGIAKTLFDGMRTHDTVMIRSAFAPGALMGGVPRPGQPVKFESIDGFLAQAGRPGPSWDEQIYDPEVRIDGGLATLWVFYTFALGEKFSHCGVDAFQLVRTNQGWKISALSDTRRTTGCETAGRRKV
jgi:hypothetical protein